jgi:rod shape-determining protein MreC
MLPLKYSKRKVTNQCKIKKSNHFGSSLEWESTGFVQLIDVPRLAAIRKGDTIVTGQSVIF